MIHLQMGCFKIPISSLKVVPHDIDPTILKTAVGGKTDSTRNVAYVLHARDGPSCLKALI